MRPVRALLKADMQSWPEYLLTLVNSAAAITGIVGAALVVLSLGMLYLSGVELNRRAEDKDVSPAEREARAARLAKTQKALTAVQKSEKELSARLSKTESELSKVRRSEEAKSLRLIQTEADLTAALKAARDHGSLATTAESQLQELRRAEESKSTRLVQLEG